MTASRSLPLLVYCHGGPIGGVTLGIFPQFMHVPGQIDPYPTEAFASAGYAVLFPMPRGGSGYGEAGHRMIINDWGGPDYKDIMAGVDHLIARGIADGDRLGVMGASYGGYMTNWIVTQTSRFKAATAGASIADLSDLYYLTDGGDLMAEYFKLPWENPEGYARSSPLTHAAKVTTPILISHGDRDPRVPLATAQKFFRALQAHGKTAEMDIYPRGGHVFYEPQQEKAVMTRNFEWMLRCIKALRVQGALGTGTSGSAQRDRCRRRRAATAAYRNARTACRRRGPRDCGRASINVPIPRSDSAPAGARRSAPACRRRCVEWSAPPRDRSAAMFGGGCFNRSAPVVRDRR